MGTPKLRPALLGYLQQQHPKYKTHSSFGQRYRQKVQYIFSIFSKNNTQKEFFLQMSFQERGCLYLSCASQATQNRSIIQILCSRLILDVLLPNLGLGVKWVRQLLHPIAYGTKRCFVALYFTRVVATERQFAESSYGFEYWMRSQYFMLHTEYALGREATHACLVNGTHTHIYILQLATK